MKARYVALLLAVVLNAAAGEITVYQPSGFGKPTLYVDGNPSGTLGLNKRIRISVPDGKHFLTSGHLDWSLALDVTGNHTIRLGGVGLAEVFPDDPRVIKELESTSE